MARSDTANTEDTSMEVTTSPTNAPQLSLEPERRDTERESLHLNKTLVLVGCGKAKRDPDDEEDLRLAAVGPEESWGGSEGPMWRAEDLYTSTYFGVKREFAGMMTRWARVSGDDSGEGAGAWAVLSAEHGVIPHWRPVAPYDTTVEDLGDDPTNPDHRVDNPYGRHRPDGQEIVTEMDRWAASVASGLSKWVAGFRDGAASVGGAGPRPNKLLVLAGSNYLDPLVKRGVFEYGIARMAGNPNQGRTFPLQERFLFDEIDAGGIGEQMGWMSEAIERLKPALPDNVETNQPELGRWGGVERSCITCGQPATEVSLAEYGGTVYCDECAPVGRCNRCDTWTHETGIGSYPLCPDCQTKGGGQKRTAVETATPDHEQLALKENFSPGSNRGGDQ